MENMKKKKVENGDSENQDKNVHLGDEKGKSLERQMKRKYLQCYFLEAYYYFL